METTLRPLWSQVLDVPEKDVADDANFFDIGGDSVGAIQLAGLANGAGVKLHAQTIFENPTFTEQVQAATDGEKQEQNGASTDSGKGSSVRTDLTGTWDMIKSCISQCNVPCHAVEDITPCVPFQAELMRSTHEQGVYIFQAVFKVDPDSIDRAKRAVGLIRERNPVFRTRIAQHESGMYQILIRDEIAWAETDEPLDVYKKRDLSRRQCYGDPLFRYAIVHNENNTYIVWSQVHAMYDRWSKMKFMDDFKQAFVEPEAFAALPERPPFRTFSDYVGALDHQAGVKHWTSQLDGLKRFDLLFPDVNKDQGFATSKTSWFRQRIPYSTPKAPKVSFDAIVQLAWALTLANIAEEDDVFFCTFRSCRQMSLENISEIIGPLWSLVPVRHRLQADQKLSDLLQAIYDLTLFGVEHEPFGIDALQQYFGHQRFGQSVLLPQPPQPESFGAEMIAHDDAGKEYRMQSMEKLWTQARAHWGLYIALTPQKGDELELWVRYDERRVDAARAKTIASQYGDMIGRITASVKDDRGETISEFCPHLSAQTSKSANDEGLTNGAEMNGHGAPKTLTHLFRNQSRTAPALIIPTESALTISHADLHDHIGQLQGELAKLGIQHGSAVSIALPNCLELIAVFLAATWQRGIAAPLNPGYKQDEFEFYIGDLGSDLLVIPQGAFEKGGPAVKAARTYKAAIAECYWDGKKIILDVKDRGKLDSRKSQDVLEAEEDDVGLVLHTSGTTGRPKAVPLTHANLLSSIESICRTYELSPNDRTLLVMPLFHVHGLLASFLSPLYSGGSAIVPPRLEPYFWKVFVQHKANWYTATPSMHRLILQFPPPDPLPRIRFIRSCSSQLAPALFHKLEEAFKAPVLESYAMTEASHLMCSNPLPPGKHYPGTVGPAQGVELRILDADGKDMQQGGVGEICIRGDSVTKGYLNNEEANKSSFTRDKFFRTGDQGKVDEQGYLTLTGRLKEMINKGGEKISPVEIDNVISQHEAVAEAVSFAIDDEAYGQDVGLAVKLAEGKSLGAQELKKWVGEKLAAHKVPKKIWFPDEIPKTATGKVQRKLVAEKMAKS